MATTEEKTELVETLKGPRYYRIQLWGYGGESAYLGLTKEQYNYWKDRDELAEDDDVLLDYMLDEDREQFDNVPLEMDFMMEVGNVFSWHDAPGELEHQYGVDYHNARITVTEISSEDYNAESIEDVVDGEDLSAWVDTLQEEDDYATELVEMSTSGYEEWAAPYILQFYSSEKGTFFEGIISTTGKFDPKKLKIFTNEYANGDDTIENIQYNGEEIDNQGGDTSGKGYSVYTWSNE